jgi:hypothetical protein
MDTEVFFSILSLFYKSGKPLNLILTDKNRNKSENAKTLDAIVQFFH